MKERLRTEDGAREERIVDQRASNDGQHMNGKIDIDLIKGKAILDGTQHRPDTV